MGFNRTGLHLEGEKAERGESTGSRAHGQRTRDQRSTSQRCAQDKLEFGYFFFQIFAVDHPLPQRVTTPHKFQPQQRLRFPGQGRPARALMERLTLGTSRKHLMQTGLHAAFSFRWTSHKLINNYLSLAGANESLTRHFQIF